MTWQRFQTLLLLIVAGLIVSHFWTEFCYTMVTENGSSDLARYSIRFTDRSQFLIFTLTTFVLSIVTIAYHKARLLQIRLCVLNMLLLIGYQIWILVEFFKLKEVYTFTVASLFPLVCVILLLLAIRYIWRDESAAIAGDMVKKGKKRLKKK